MDEEKSRTKEEELLKEYRSTGRGELRRHRRWYALGCRGSMADRKDKSGAGRGFWLR